ncbi:MAG: hypothetical protein WD151_00905 [Phycisphaeraceae bacterium]
MNGELTFEEQGVRIDGTVFTWDELLTLKVTGAAGALPSPHVLRLAGGERWHGRVVSYDADRVRFDVPEIGVVELPANTVVGIDLKPNLPWPVERRGVLERREGAAVPSQLLWIEGEEVAVDSMLGVLTISQEEVLRYTFAEADEGASHAEEDELTLISGTLIRGRMTPGQASVTVEHAVIGERSVPWSEVSAFRRRSGSVVYLADLEPVEHHTKPLLAESLPIEAFFRRTDAAGALDAWLLQPESAVTYELPTVEGPVWLRAVIAPRRRSQGTVTVRVRAGDATVWQESVAPDDALRMVDVALGTARTVTIELEYVEPIRFPSGVQLMDPLVLIGGS